MADLRDLVLQRVDLVELIGHWVALQQAGREWRGRCPFHDERTASFYVNGEKGLFHCHGCKAGGNAVDFVMRMEHLEFKEALEWFVRRYNLPRPSVTPAQARLQGSKERLWEGNALAAAFYRKALQGSSGEPARKYLAQRGIAESQIADFDLGYAPRDWDALSRYLQGQNYGTAEMLKLSLARQRSGDMDLSGSGCYDFFRHRVIFPIRDVLGRVVSFAGRALADEDQPKYLNTSTTPLYDKSSTLYNLDRAKGHLKDSGVVIVEGYMDVIGLAAAGIANAVATCGTSLTVQHVRLLSRYTDTVYLCFDADPAGRNAAWSAGRLFLQHGVDPRVVRLPHGKDPDDWARKAGDKAIEEWAKFTQHSVSTVANWLELQLEAKDMNTQGSKRNLVTQLRTLYHSIPDTLLRHEVQRDVASILRLSATDVASLLETSSTQNSASQNPMRSSTLHNARQRALLQGTAPLEDVLVQRLAASQAMLTLVQRLSTTGEEPLSEPEYLTQPLAQQVMQAALLVDDHLKLRSDERFSTYIAEVSAAGAAVQDSNLHLIQRLSNAYYQRQIDALIAQFRTAENAGDDAAMLQLHLQVDAMKKRIRKLSSLGEEQA